jgi:hypothetical protein
MPDNLTRRRQDRIDTLMSLLTALAWVLGFAGVGVAYGLMIGWGR